MRIFDPAALETPKLDAPSKRSATANGRCRSSAAAQITTITYPFNPLDAVGWKGNLSAVKLNWRDIRPVMSHRYHIPPSVHSTFVADRFVVCTFVPRPHRKRSRRAESAVLPFQRRLRRSDLLSRGRILQPRQHPSRHGDVPSQRLHPRSASQGLRGRRQGGQDHDRRSGRDDRRARSRSTWRRPPKRPKTRPMPTAGRPK